MSEIQPNISCPKCNAQSPKGLLFCPFCGDRFDEADPTLLNMEAGTCPFCFSHDDLNKRFCTACGAQLDQTQAKVGLKALVRRTGFNWIGNSSEFLTRSITGTDVTAVEQPSPGSGRSTLLLACVPGAVIGLLTTALMVLLAKPSLNYILARCFCPRHGLAVALQLPQPGKFQDIWVRLESSDGRTVLRKHPDNDGLLTVGDIPNSDVPDGTYNMKVEADGCATGFTQVKIDSARPTLVGFPSPVILPPDGSGIGSDSK